VSRPRRAVALWIAQPQPLNQIGSGSVSCVSSVNNGLAIFGRVSSLPQAGYVQYCVHNYNNIEWRLVLSANLCWVRPVVVLSLQSLWGPWRPVPARVPNPTGWHHSWLSQSRVTPYITVSIEPRVGCLSLDVNWSSLVSYQRPSGRQWLYDLGGVMFQRWIPFRCFRNPLAKRGLRQARVRQRASRSAIFSWFY